ncbi:MAG TPA: hypothetical protein VMI06_15880 [Terriglobia bacterium]|nr:hypothetical protein [Terriglobia bacterium]
MKDIHSIVHDLEEEAIFTTNVMVKASFGQANSFGDFLHRSPRVAFLIEDARRNPTDVPEAVLSFGRTRHEQNLSQSILAGQDKTAMGWFDTKKNLLLAYV